MNYSWKIVALVGMVIFLISVFLPLTANSPPDWSTVNWYQNAGTWDWNASFTAASAFTVGILLLMILWPIALLLCIVAIFRRRASIAAGIVGIISWTGGIMYLNGFPGGSPDYGAAVFVGFIGAIIMFVANFVGKGPQAPPPVPTQATTSQAPLTPSQAPVPPATPPPPPQAVTPLCPTCGQPLTFMSQYGRWYCYNCKKYS